MRARNIKPGFFKNEQLADCSAFARLLFPGLWMIADRDGCLEYRPKRWKAEVFPYDDIDCAVLCAELENAGLVTRYAVGGNEYIFIPKFKDHQNPHKNEPESGIPPYTSDNKNNGKRECTEDSSNYASAQEKAQTNPADSLIPDSLIPDSRKDSSLRSESSCPGSAEPDEQSGPTDARQPDLRGKKQAKSKPQPLPEDSEAYRLAVYMRDTLRANVPTLKEPDLQKWAQAFDVALRNDERMGEPRFVAQVVKWACSDSFWRANIQSPDKLRKQFDQLTAKMEAEAAKARASPAGYVSPAQRRLEANRQAMQEFINAGV